MTRLVVVGVGGRMGRALVACAGEFEGLDIVQGVTGRDTDGSADMTRQVDVVVDFSTPLGFTEALEAAVDRGAAFVSGSTGLSESQLSALNQASTQIPTLLAANFSVGVNIIEHLVEAAARAAEGFDIEVFEAHHRNKVDAPSGTALFLGEAAARGRDTRLDEVAVLSREGHTGARSNEEIGFQVVRGGSVVGEHTVFFLGSGERIELTHRAQEREIFARGALRAAAWIATQSAGAYSMRNVLFGS